MRAVQLIDANKVLHEEHLDEILASAKDDSIHTVAILGPQSSGKSTLLNGLFGTGFAVMDEARREQTTLGIWASYVSDCNILVLDVEGTDGRERGESQDFERKSALFSLATSEVLIVNIWENSVGLYHAANLGLLRTVMDVHLQLLGAASGNGPISKTVLLFVVRDYVGKTPQTNLSSVLLNSLDTIWATLSKSEGLADLRLQDVFSVRFSFLPHKILQPADFTDAVEQLKGRFCNTLADDFLFAQPLRDLVGRRDLPVYLRSLWAKIVANKDLDLPTERELLAQYRCDEIARTVLRDFNQSLASVRKTISAGKIASSLAKTILNAVAVAQQFYTEQTLRYAENIAASKWDEIIEAMRDAAADLSDDNLALAAKEAIAKFEADARTAMASSVKNGRLDKAFGEKLNLAQSNARDLFAKAISEANLSDLDISMDIKATDFEQLLEEHNNSARLGACDAAVTVSVKAIAGDFAKLVSPNSFGFGEKSTSVADDLVAALEDMAQRMHDAVEQICNVAGVGSDSQRIIIAGSMSSLGAAIAESMRSEFSAQRISDRVVHVFEKKFMYDNADLPRIWSNDSEVETAYKSAVEATAEKITQFSARDRMSEALSTKLGVFGKMLAEDYQCFNILLSDTEAEATAQRLSKVFERRYIEAKRSTIVIQTRIPPWMIALLLILGWNEIVAVLSSPLYLMLCIIGGFIAFAVYWLNLTPHLHMLLNLGRSVLHNIISPPVHAADLKEKPE